MMRISSFPFLVTLGLISGAVLCSCSDGELPAIETGDDGGAGKFGTGGAGGTGGDGGAGGVGGDGTGGQPPTCQANESACGTYCCDNETQECRNDKCESKSTPCVEGTSCGSGRVCNDKDSCVDGCYIDGTFYEHGDKNPANKCESCTASHTEAWTPGEVGASCDVGKVCSASLVCDDGCYIGGSQYEPGDKNPSNECQVCDVANTSDWSPIASGTECGGGKVCNDAGGCVEGCVIDGVSYPEGMMNTAGVCEVCSPGKNKTGWSHADLGVACDDGSYCDAVHECKSGCWLDGTHYEHGQENPSNKCETCAAANQTVWTGTAPVGTSCADKKICDAGFQCVPGCVVGGVFFDGGVTNGSNECEICDPDSSTTGWSSKPAGTTCGTGNVCDADGKCDWGCVVDDVFYEHGKVNEDNECKICDASKAQDGWTNMPQTTPCEDGGNYCNVGGACKQGCSIDGVFYEDGALNGPCEECNSAVSDVGWTPKPAGTSCGSAVGDVCNGTGDCSLGCMIDGLGFVGNLKQNQSNPCEECNVEKSTSEWVPRDEGEVCESEGPSSYCNDVGVCVGGCLIGEKVYPEGTPQPNNTCKGCYADADPNAWTANLVLSEGDECNGVPGGKYCSATYECKDGCKFGGNVYWDRDINAANECLYCDAGVYYGWSHVEVGTACGSAGNICNGGTCMLGCAIDDVFVEPGSVNPDQDCQVCVPTESTDSYSDASFGDAACNAPGHFCNAALECIEGCYIGGTYWERDYPNPDNRCQACTVESATDWSDRFSLPYQQCDTGKYCNSANACTSGCWIGDEHRDYGYRPGNTCQSCLASSVFGWSLVGPVDAECNASNAMHCDSGYNCVSSCKIGGAVYPPNYQNDNCQVCKVSNPGGWSLADAGTACGAGSGGKCDASGNCITAVASSIATGGSHTCGLLSDGKVVCWGRNDYGQLGRGTSSAYEAAPAPVTGLPSGVTKITAGSMHTCALAGTIAYCWGDNLYGQIGDGTNIQRDAPAVVDLTNVTDIEAGSDHTCAIITSGATTGVPRCWGKNDRGQVGDGTTTNRNSPRVLSTAGGSFTQGVTAFAPGGLHTCALRLGIHVWCWGSTEFGQCGDNMGGGGYGQTRLYPTNVANNVVKISAGGGHTCAIDTGGEVWCTGDGSFGQLGRGNTASSTLFQPVTGLSSGVVDIKAGWSYSCALTSSRGVTCWGNNTHGQLGRGTSGGNGSTQQLISSLSSGVKVLGQITNVHTCVITDAGEVKCWGRNNNAALGLGFTSPPDTAFPTPENVVGFP